LNVSSARHDRVGRLFLEAARLDEQVRRAFLDSRCGDDPSIADEVEALLRHRESPALAIATGAINVGAVLDGALDADSARPSPGSAFSSVARYKIVRVLGEGGMGTVYLAEQDQPRRTVALKVMRSTISNAERLRKRFRLEADVLGRLEHPGIARIYDAGTATVTTADGTATVPYFAMEYVDGLPLTEHIAKAKLGTRDRMRIIARIAEAVGAAHRIGVVHRDIKPANVLVDQAGQPKVLDFGVARATDSDVALTTVQTDVGQLIGTLGYMSPEQVAGDPTKIGVRSDVYALGALAYEVLTGRPLVDARGKTVAEVARIIRDDDPTKLSSVDRVFRGDLETIVAKAIEKDPERRYSDASAFATDVDHYLRDEPIVARPPTTFYQLSKFARRNRALVAGVIATFIVLVLGLVGTSIGFVNARQQTELARAAQAKADRRFDEVHKLARAFVYDVHDKIVDLPGSTEARKTIVTIALTYLDSLAGEATENVLLAGDVSEAYLKIGQAQGYGSRANLGDRAGARKSFEKALEIRERLVAANPTDEKLPLLVARARNQIANLDWAEGHCEEAIAGFQLSLDVREAYLAKSPDDPPRLREVGISEQWIGNVHREMATLAERAGDEASSQKHLDEALVHYTRYLDMMQRIATPENRGSQRDLSVAVEKIGDILSDLKRHDEALVQYREGLEIRERLYAANPDNAESTTDLAVALGKTGSRLMSLTRLDEAAPLLERSHELLVKCSALDPSDVFAKQNIAVAEMRRGELAVNRYDAQKKATGTRDAALLDECELRARNALAVLGELAAMGKLDKSKEAWRAGFNQLLGEASTRRSAPD